MDRQRCRKTDRQRIERDKDRNARKYMDNGQREIQADRDTERKTDIKINGRSHGNNSSELGRQADRNTGI